MNKRFSECFFILLFKSLIFSVKKFCLEPACALLLCLSWCVQPPATSPKGFTSRAYYIYTRAGVGNFGAISALHF